MIGNMIVTKVGQDGLQLKPGGPNASPWLQNVRVDLDGTWRPRYGLKIVRSFADRIAMLESAYQSTDNKHYLYVLPQDSFLYKGAITEIGAAIGTSMVALIPLANWNSEFKNAGTAIGPSSNPTATEMRLAFSFPGFGVGNQQAYDQTGAKITFSGGGDVKGVPFTHGVQLAFVQKSTLVWSSVGDAYTIPVLNYTYHKPGLGEGVAGVYWQEDLSYVFCSNGIYSIQGAPLESAKFTALTAPPIAGPAATSVCRCRDRIAYLGPGPSIYMIGGGLEAIEEPIRPVLNDYVDATYFSLFYDPLIDCLCVTPLVDQAVSPGVANDTYLYSLQVGKWIGQYRCADSTKGISKVVYAGPNTDSLSVPRNRPPYGLAVAAVSNLLSRYDHLTYGDELSAGVVTPFTCAIETPPMGLEQAPAALKQLLDVYIDGKGEWTVKLMYRNGSGDAWQTETIGTASAPGWVYAGRQVPLYRERKIRIEASSSATLAVKHIAFRERPVYE